MEVRLALLPMTGKHTNKPTKRGHERGAWIQPGFFKDLNVYVDSQRTDQKMSIEKAMELVGAKVQSSVDNVDVVISPKRATVPSTRSRGHKMVLNLVEENRPAKNVLVSEIPWVDEVIKREPQVLPDSVMVVADVAGRYAPAFKSFKQIPCISDLKDQPRGFTFCPFDKLTKDPSELIRTQERKPRRVCTPGDQPPHGALCEICGVAIEHPELHRASASHTRTVAGCNWATFDALALHIYQKGRLTG